MVHRYDIRARHNQESRQQIGIIREMHPHILACAVTREKQGSRTKNKKPKTRNLVLGTRTHRDKLCLRRK